jgi:hypothetical protein
MAYSPNPADAGATVTFTALVSPAAGTGTPTGSITFTIDGTAAATVPLQVVGGSDQAIYSTSTLAPGTHTIVATYSGDSTFAGSATQQATETIKSPTQPGNPQATSTTLVSSASPSDVGASVTFTATVAPTNGAGAPTGSVTFTIDGVAQRSVPLRMVGGHDQATFSTATLAAGTHTIVAAYDGDATFAASTVPHSLTQVVVAPTPTGTPSSRPGTARPPVVVSFKRYGIHKQPTRLVFMFSTAMDPARAQDVHNYLILNPARHEIPVRKAVYDPAARSVTVRPRRRINLHATYYVAINAIGADGVANTQGVLLDGFGAGNAGNDYVSSLNRKNLVLTPAEIQRRLPRWLFQKPAASSPAPGPGPVSGAR